jgi:hypothetical protein
MRSRLRRISAAQRCRNRRLDFGRRALVAFSYRGTGAAPRQIDKWRQHLLGEDRSMIEIPSLRPETRYGVPTCDRFLFNRLYIVGYSYLLRQPRFAMQVVDAESMVAPSLR